MFRSRQIQLQATSLFTEIEILLRIIYPNHSQPGYPPPHHHTHTHTHTHVRDFGCGDGEGNSDQKMTLVSSQIPIQSSALNDISTRETELHKMNYSQLGQRRFGATYHTLLAASIFVFWSFVSIIPVYNKFFFRKSLFPYPIATAGIQLSFVSILLAALNIVQHLFYSSRIENSRGQGNATRSWILGPHLLWKVKWCFPIGALFGMKYGITNLGLDLVPAPTHLLLQSTDLVWTVLWAYIINKEVVSIVELFCLVGCIFGSIILGWSIGNSSLSAPFFAILINLISPIFLGLCLATLRLACTELMCRDNRVGGTVSSVELTSIKLVLSSSVALVLACIMEGGDETKDSWWVAFLELKRSTQLGVIGGAVLIAVFQVNCTFLTFLSSTVAVGLVGQVKIIPQWIVSTIYARRTTGFEMHRINIVGAVCIMVSAAAYAFCNYNKSPLPTRGIEGEDEENGNSHHDLYKTSPIDNEEKALLSRAHIGSSYMR